MRYWIHPESCSAFSTEDHDTEPFDDTGCLDEVDLEAFLRCYAEFNGLDQRDMELIG